MSTNTNPFAEWSSLSSDGAPSIFGALPSIQVSSTLPVFISDSLVLQFSNPDNILNCIVCGPQNRSLYSINSDGGITTFRNTENQVFALVRMEPSAIIEITGCTARQRVRDWLRLAPDQSCRYMSLGRATYFWKPVQQYIILLDENSSVLARISRTSNTTALEITRLALQLNLLHPCIVAAALFLSGRHID